MHAEPMKARDQNPLNDTNETILVYAIHDIDNGVTTEAASFTEWRVESSAMIRGSQELATPLSCKIKCWAPFIQNSGFQDNL